MQDLPIAKKTFSFGKQFWQHFNQLLSWPMLSFLLLLIFAFAAISWNHQKSQLRLLQSLAIQDASLLSEILTEFRILYTDTIVSRLKPLGIPATHNFADVDNAIPLPATFSLLLGNRLKAHNAGVHVRLYSPYPFPWRASTGGLRDTFARDAWKALKQNPDKPFYRFETLDGGPVIRLATADILQAACVDCHNNYTGTPRTGWKAGDLRGILEVISPLGKTLKERVAVASESVFLLFGIALLMLSFLGLVLAKFYKEKSRAEALANEARRANQAKTEFLSTTSHELRTPLTAISGSLSILLSGVVVELPQKSKKLLDIAHSNCTRLLLLINDILDINKMIAGEMVFNLDHHDLADLLKSAIDSNRSYGETFNIKFNLTHAEKGLIVNVDANRFQQVMSNLMSNAAKFSPPGESVDISVSSTADLHRISVTDKGPGIPENFRSRIFDRFTQVDASDTKKRGGTGLGMGIAKMIAEEFGGTIDFETEIGKGSTFFVDLPAQAKKV